MAEMIEEANDMGSPGMGVCRGRYALRVVWRGGDGRGFGGDDALQEPDLVERGLGVAIRGLDDLEGNVAVRSGRVPSDKLHAIERHVHALCVLCQPDRREVAPAELADNDVASV